MKRNIFGSVVYSGTIKKALLQSCPYLVFILIPIISSRYQRELRRPIALALAIPLLVLVFYAPFNWHGGKAFNLRYLLPALPFLSLLVGWTVVALTKGLNKSQIQLVALSSLLVAIVHLVVRRAIDMPLKLDLTGNIDLFYGTIPHIFIALFLVLVILWVRRPKSRVIRTIVLSGLASGIVWSGLVAFAYDAPRTLDIRTSRLWLAEKTAQYVEDGALLLVESASHLYTLVSFRPNVRIASPANDDFSDTSKLIDFSLKKGRAVYGILSPKSWERFFDKFPSYAVETTIVTYLDPYVVRRIEQQ
jgi:hypothetical protein